MAKEIEARLKSLGIELPEGSLPAAAYANAVTVNGLMFGAVSVRDNLPIIVNSIFEVE
ncbi:hypothetical protein [Saccharibacillus endophyticus]|uniref:RidA family protein n=1 Tax=Saccharibacillus endophyticus TaxID=2060666 RepID=A0ABQ1ZVS7_9BACL|nr:hypothetical protein [Saccharibacillus endophyticus]GGH79926.1 hypothetical protein GCM10007362_27460 [Saccharibacillus endophyticus]